MADIDVEKEMLKRLPAKIDHGTFLEITDELFVNTFCLPEKDMFDFIMYTIVNEKKTMYKSDDLEAFDEANYMYFKGSIPILLSSHVDTVMKESSRIFVTEKSRLMTGELDAYLGGDDRAGVLGMLWIIKNGFKPHLLFTKGEEHGLIGAASAGEKIAAPDVKYIIALDRCGDGECAYYNNGNEDFKKYIKTFGLKEVTGTGNDIRELCPAWDVSGVNVSIGYHAPHTVKDYVSIPEMKKCIDRIEQMIQSPPTEKFPFVMQEEDRFFGKNIAYTCNYRGMRRGRRGTEEEDLEDAYEDYVDVALESGLTVDVSYDEFRDLFDREEMTYGKKNKGKKKENRHQNIFPRRPFLYEVSDIEHNKILSGMNLLSNHLKDIFFDFKRMTWHYGDCNREEHIDLETFDFFGVLDIYRIEKKDQKLLRHVIDYLDKKSYIWSRSSCYFD